MSGLAAYMRFVEGVRGALFVVGAITLAICAVDWAVRTRRLNPFSGVARFFRSRVEPLMAPVERSVVRAGGRQATVPWWTVFAVIVIGIVFLSLLQFIGNLLSQVLFVSANPGDAPKLLLSWAFAIVRLALLVRVISSWLPVSPRSWWIRWSYLLTDWMIVPLRRVVPNIGMIDITPIVAYFILYLLQSFLGV